MAGPWERFGDTAEAAPAQAEGGSWQKFQEPAAAPAPDEPVDQISRLRAGLPPLAAPEPRTPSTADLIFPQYTSLKNVLSRFGQEAAESWGHERLGLSDESYQAMAKAGLFRQPGETMGSPFKAFNEAIMIPSAIALDAAMRTMTAGFRGAQGAAFVALGEGSFARDVAAMPEAFFGTPHPLGIPKVRGGAEPVKPGAPPEVVTLDEARALGAIGPEKPPGLPEGPPEQAARATIPPAEPPGGGPPPEAPRGSPGAPEAETPWMSRFKESVGKLKTSDDVKALIINAAREQGEFPEARAGAVPLQHVESLSDATGIPSKDIYAKALDQAVGVPGEEVGPISAAKRGVSRLMRNDAEVRVSMQLMLQANDDLHLAMQKVAAKAGADDLAELAELQTARMRRDLAVEQVAGLRAEWGRTGNVFQEFMEASKDAKAFGDFLKDKKGQTLDDLRDLARAGSGLDPRTQLPGFASNLRGASAWDKFRWFWVNSLISGPFTHAKYIIANEAYAIYEAGLVAPIAGAVGTARRAITGSREGAYVGEGPARLYGLMAGTPDALVAAWTAAKTGMQTPLPSQLGLYAKAIADGMPEARAAAEFLPKRNQALPYQQKPIEGPLGTAIGLPSRGAQAIHSFFNFLGERSEREAQAWRAAAKEGSPLEDGFLERRQRALENPSEADIKAQTDAGYRMTFITELGPKGKKLVELVNMVPAAQLITPFLHIPMNIVKRAYETTPAAFLDADMRAELTGKKGAAAQDYAIARVVAGSAVSAWAAYMVTADRMTGSGPSDPKQRAQWIATGHHPYSVRIGDYWVSFSRFGPVGTMLAINSNLAEAIPHVKPDSEELTKAVAHVVHGVGKTIEDEVGMQGLSNLIEAIHEPERKGARFIGASVGSLMPYSSALRQTASYMDPHMRVAKDVVDQLRYQIPIVRQGLLPKRDWLGAPIPNTGYEAIVKMGLATPDPLGVEMQAIDLRPAPPQDRIHGVKLPPALYDKYQATAGPFTRTMLETLINQPGWQDMPPYIRQNIVKSTIKSTREAAQAAMQAAYPQLIMQAVQDRANKITGQKPTKLQDQP